MRVTDDAGAQSVSQRSVEVTDSSDAAVGRRSSGSSNPRMLFAQATDPDGAIAQYAWDLDGDGVFDDAVGPPREHRRPSPPACTATFELAVRVTDNDGMATDAGHDRYACSTSRRCRHRCT